MNNKSIVDGLIKMRQKYKKEYDETSGTSLNTVRKQLLARVVNDLTDILTGAGERGLQ